MSPSPPPLSKADRLAIGGAVAPAVRRQAGAPRVVTVVGKDGQPVRQTTAVEVAKSVLARADVEFSVQEGKRPAYVVCAMCGRAVPVPVKGRVPSMCRVECKPFSDEEKAAALDRIRAFAAAKGYPTEWVDTVYAAQFGNGG